MCCKTHSEITSKTDACWHKPMWNASAPSSPAAPADLGNWTDLRLSLSRTARLLTDKTASPQSDPNSGILERASRLSSLYRLLKFAPGKYLEQLIHDAAKSFHGAVPPVRSQCWCTRSKHRDSAPFTSFFI